MKKITLIIALTFGAFLSSNAQQGDKFVAVGGGILAPGCTNCEMFSGFNLSGGYAFSDNIVATLDFGYYTNEDLRMPSIGVTGKYYVNEAFNGFYLGPEVAYTNLTIKDVDDFNESHFGVGFAMGYTIAIGSLGLEPYLGYGTWNEDWKGKVSAGLKLGFKF